MRKMILLVLLLVAAFNVETVRAQEEGHDEVENLTEEPEELPAEVVVDPEPEPNVTEPTSENVEATVTEAPEPVVTETSTPTEPTTEEATPTPTVIEVRTVVVRETALPTVDPELAAPVEAREKNDPDIYLGFFFMFDPTDPEGLLGGDIRFSVPFQELGTEHVALTLSMELGALYGTGQNGLWGASALPLGAHAAVTAGVRSRFGPLSLGVRGGYSPWFYTGGYLSDIRVVHAGLAGFEIGVGAPVFTVTASIDLHIGEGAGWLLPVAALGVCF